jgi:hypothetical protein
MPGSLRRARLHLLLAAVWRLGTRLPAESGRPGGRRYVAAQARTAARPGSACLTRGPGRLQTGLRGKNPLGFSDLTLKSDLAAAQALDELADAAAAGRLLGEAGAPADLPPYYDPSFWVRPMRATPWDKSK